MATAPLPLSPRFQQRLEEFKNELGPDLKEDFEFSTLDGLKKFIHDIQAEQMKSRTMANLKRIGPFLEAMDQFDKVIQVFLNAADLLAFVWGPVKFLLLSAHTYHDAFNALLDVYLDIGENIPLLAQYEQLFKERSEMHVALEFVYTDIMEFHSSAIKYFKSRVWKQLFHATWKTFRTKFEPTLSNLRRHKLLLGTQSNLLYLQQYQVDRRRTQVEFEKIERQAEQVRKIAIVNWLSAADSDSDYQAAASARYGAPNSGKWIFEQEAMKRWLDLKYPLQPLLWVNGIPGAGKTVLASLIVEECRKSSSRDVLFFFHKYGDEKKNSLIAILRGLLTQAMRLRPILIPFLFEEVTKSGSSSLEDVELAKQLIELSLETFDLAFLVLDGLDECPKRAKQPVTTFFRSLIDRSNQRNPGQLRCCFFSQRDNDVGGLLKGVPSFTITSKQNSTDIWSFCQARAEIIQEELEYPEEKAKQIADKVSSRADGMFVFAVLVMTYLEQQTSWRNLEEEIDDIPLDLDDVYGRIVKRVLYDSSPAEQAAARMLLGWLLVAVRPLKWHEIQGAIAYDSANNSFDLQNAKLRRSPKKLCGSLVEQFVDGEIRLVHLSAKLYLDRNVINGPEEELNFLCRCLNYLCLPAFDQSLEEPSARAYVLHGYYAFVDYALGSWTIHLENISRSRQLEQEKAFEQLSSAIRAFFKAHPLSGGRLLPNTIAKKLLKHFEAESYFNELCQTMHVAKDLALDQAEEDTITSNGSDYLIQQVGLARRLIENLAPEITKKDQLQDIYGCKLFKCPRLNCQYFSEGFSTAQERDKHSNKHKRPYQCSFSGCVVSFIGYPTERQLRKHEAEAHSKGASASAFPWHGTPSSRDVCQQIQQGNDEAFDWWIEQFEGQIPLHEIWYSNKTSGPLRVAIRTGNVHILRRILDSSDPVILRSKAGGRPRGTPYATKLIGEAMKVPNIDAAEEILSRATSMRDEDIMESFQLAMRLTSDRMALALLRHQNCGLARDQQRANTYLNLAIDFGRLAVVRWLVLDRAIDPNTPAANEEMALSRAIASNQAEIKRFLVESGKCSSSVEKIAKDAHRKGDIELLELLFLQNTTQSEPFHTRWIQTTKLLKASREGDVHFVQEILSQPNPPINPPSLGPTPLHIAITGCHTKVVDMLLQYGALKVDQPVSFEARARLGLKGATAIEESVFLLNSTLFSKVLDNTKYLPISLVDLVKREGTSEMQKAIEAKIEALKSDPNAPFGDLGNNDNGVFNLDFGSMDSGDVLENFDFDTFLHTDDGTSSAFTFDQAFLGDGFEADAL